MKLRCLTFFVAPLVIAGGCFFPPGEPPPPTPEVDPLSLAVPGSSGGTVNLDADSEDRIVVSPTQNVFLTTTCEPGVEILGDTFAGWVPCSNFAGGNVTSLGTLRLRAAAGTSGDLNYQVTVSHPTP